MSPIGHAQPHPPSPHALARLQPLIKPLLFGMLAALLAAGFAWLGSEVVEGDTRGFDLYVLHTAAALRLAHPWLGEVMRDFSGLGSTAVLTLFVLLAVGYLALLSARVAAALVAASALMGAVLLSLLKAGFGRLRPDPALAEIVATGWSFPSGHATMSAVVFLTMGALVATTHPKRSERAYILSAATLLTALVGLSRVALGVHWATDVLAGWAFGSAWAIAWLLVANRLDALATT